MISPCLGFWCLCLWRNLVCDDHVQNLSPKDNLSLECDMKKGKKKVENAVKYVNLCVDNEIIYTPCIYNGFPGNVLNV